MVMNGLLWPQKLPKMILCVFYLQWHKLNVDCTLGKYLIFVVLIVARINFKSNENVKNRIEIHYLFQYQVIFFQTINSIYTIQSFNKYLSPSMCQALFQEFRIHNKQNKQNAVYILAQWISNLSLLQKSPVELLKQFVKTVF